MLLQVPLKTVPAYAELSVHVMSMAVLELSRLGRVSVMVSVETRGQATVKFTLIEVN